MAEQLKLNIDRPAWHSSSYHFVPREKPVQKRIVKEREDTPEKRLMRAPDRPNLDKRQD